MAPNLNNKNRRYTKAKRALVWKPMSSNSAPQNRAIYFIMLALAVWGGLLALGAFLFDFDIRKFFIVTGVVGLFLVFWLLLIVTHRRESKAGEFDDAPYGGENAKSDHRKNPD